MTFGYSDLTFLLLPLAVISGWMAGRRDQKRNEGATSDKADSGYFRGINFILNEQPDKAIEIFTQMLSENEEMLETHLALGSLFRRRGEVERAIRIHQNLIARTSLGSEQRAIALCELAMDYHRAGLLDRAENIFRELTDMPAHTEQALRMLMLIYEQEREWEKAAECARQLERKTEHNTRNIQAQYCCELAEVSLHNGKTSEARQHLTNALRTDQHCVRASLLLGKLASDSSCWQEAIDAWKMVEQQNSAYLDEAMEGIIRCHLCLKKEEALYHYLQDVVGRTYSLHALMMLLEMMKVRNGPVSAMSRLKTILLQYPPLHGLRILAGIHAEGNQEPTADEAGLLDTLLKRLTEEPFRYLCQQCGFQGAALHWQCPACHQWSSMKPVSCSGHDQEGKVVSHDVPGDAGAALGVGST